MKVASQANGRSNVASARRSGPRAAAAKPAAEADALRRLRLMERVFAECEWADRGELAAARRRARASVAELLPREAGDLEHARAALLIAAAEMLAAVRGDLASAPQRAAPLLQALERAIGVSRVGIAREVLRAPELLTLLPAVAVESQLTMLVAAAPLRSASLWALDDAEQVGCVSHVGEGAPSRGARELAGRLLAGVRVEPSPRRLLLGLAVGRWKQPLAALVGSARPGMRERCRPVLIEAAPMLGAVLEREALLAGNAATERALVESSERKVTRLGFDLHDGPIQEVAILAEDLRLLERQLQHVVQAPAHQELVRGRMEDLEAQLVSLEAEL